MKAVGFILFLLTCGGAGAQSIQVIVPSQPVVVGTAFQVQYIITDPSEFAEASTPVFDNCQLISGPHIYKGNAVIEGKVQPIQNIAYTLVPLKTGLIRIGGINVHFKSLPDLQSADAGVTVVPQPKASFNLRSSYTDVALYAPSSQKDRQKLIDENLFIKTEVNKKECYEGEPVVATFKLYSRLQSSSEAEKSPAFYGFSVVDVLNINEAHTAVETVNGKVFNTSILRQVQLYPVQSGNLTIDEMYVQNEIEFDDSITHEKIRVEKEIVTKPIVVTVKPLPEKKPDDFTGAVGNFVMDAHLEKSQVSLNSQAKLFVRLRGKGNFIQFGQPLIQWPEGMEPFEPAIVDKLNKNVSPIEGERTYVFEFSPASIGKIDFLPISFSYFDVRDKAFRNLVADSLILNVARAQKKPVLNVIREKVSNPYLWVIPLLAAGGIAFFLLLRKRKQDHKGPGNTESSSSSPYLQQIAALDLNELTEKQSCIEIQKILTTFEKAFSASLTTEQKQEIRSILKECELAVYSHEIPENQKEALKLRAARLIKSAG